MKKIIIVIVVLLLFVTIALNASKNTSSTEMLLSESKARTNIEDIISAIEVVGESAHKGVEIKSTGFKGEVSQPPSFSKESLTEYKIKDDNLKVVYGTTEVTLTSSGTAFADAQYAHLGLPSVARKDILDDNAKDGKFTLDTLSDSVTAGIQPIIKEDSLWLKDFLYSDEGLGLDKLIVSDSDFDNLKFDDVAKQEQLMAFIFGGNGSTTLNWNDFKSDRIIAMKQVDVKALTGLDNNESIQQMINPNLTSIYQVDHVNTNLLTGLSAHSFATANGLSDIAKLSKFVNHLNQTMGNKLVLVPHKSASTLMVDGTPTFVLN